MHLIQEREQEVEPSNAQRRCTFSAQLRLEPTSQGALEPAQAGQYMEFTCHTPTSRLPPVFWLTA